MAEFSKNSMNWHDNPLESDVHKPHVVRPVLYPIRLTKMPAQPLSQRFRLKKCAQNFSHAPGQYNRIPIIHLNVWNALNDLNSTVCSALSPQ
jgi:hypothetical protein